MPPLTSCLYDDADAEKFHTRKNFPKKTCFGQDTSAPGACQAGNRGVFREKTH